MLGKGVLAPSGPAHLTAERSGSKFINTKPPELRFRALLTKGAAELKLAKPGA
jgi:hypothetical protein